MTKDERREQYEQALKNQAPTWGASVRELMLAAYSRGYDEGVADGVVRGQNYQAQVTEMVMGCDN